MPVSLKVKTLGALQFIFGEQRLPFLAAFYRTSVESDAPKVDRAVVHEWAHAG
jgi:hypothetical protein